MQAETGKLLSDRELMERYKMALEAIVRVSGQYGIQTYHMSVIASEALKK